MQTTELKLTDTHCHLYADEFDEDRTQMINKAIDGGVVQMMIPNIDLDTIPIMNKVVEQFPSNCFPMLGLHPCSVRDNYNVVLDQMKEELMSGKYVGVGETGVDLYWDTAYRDQQIDAFEQQIQLGKEFDLPVIIHSRESLDLNIDIISKHQNGHLKGIFHCFGGTAKQAMQIHELGFKIGIGGIITFKKSDLPDVLPNLPREIFVLETDSPYLAPVPNRGKRNEPAFLLLIAARLSEVLGISVPELAELTNSNAKAVFNKKG